MIVMLNVIFAESDKQASYAECRFAECRYAQCLGASKKCFTLLGFCFTRKYYGSR
jgi:hypothetical protein